MGWNWVEKTDLSLVKEGVPLGGRRHNHKYSQTHGSNLLWRSCPYWLKKLADLKWELASRFGQYLDRFFVWPDSLSPRQKNEILLSRSWFNVKRVFFVLSFSPFFWKHTVSPSIFWVCFRSKKFRKTATQSWNWRRDCHRRQPVAERCSWLSWLQVEVFRYGSKTCILWII